MTHHAIAALLPLFRPGIEVEHHAVPTGRPGDGKTRLAVAEGRLSACERPLQPVYLAPGHLPASKAGFQLAHYLFQRLDPQPLVFIARRGQLPEPLEPE